MNNKGKIEEDEICNQFFRRINVKKILHNMKKKQKAYSVGREDNFGVKCFRA